MANIEEAQNRLFKNVFICRKCKRKQKANPQKIHEGKVKCRKCGSGSFKPLRKK